MRIAFVTSEYVTEAEFDGGLANYLKRVTASLTQRGHSVEIFTQSSEDSTIQYDGITVHRVRPPDRAVTLLHRVLRNRIAPIALRIIPLSIKMRTRVLQRHRELPFDIVQVSNYLSVGCAFTAFFPIPVVVRISSYQPYLQQYDQIPMTLTMRWIIALERFTVQRVNAAYSPSDLGAEAFRKHLRADVAVIRPPFIRDNFVQYSQDRVDALHGARYMLYFGAIRIIKGCLVMGEALQILLPQLPDFHFVIVGRDTNTATGKTFTQGILERAGAHAERVHYIGAIHQDVLVPLIEGAQGILLPSRMENLPNALLESMALGKVVVATRGASYDELIEDGVSGLLVPIDDPQAMAAAMLKVWHMPDTERARIGKAAQAALAPLRPEQACQSLEEFFGAIIDSRHDSQRNTQLKRK